MKTLIFLMFVVTVVSALVWRLRKSRAEANLARRKAVERRRKQEKETLAQDPDTVWPVIIRPVRGDQAPAGSAATEELTMTAIEFSPPGDLSPRQDRARKLAS